jgi:MoxR-like ATPase
MQNKQNEIENLAPQISKIIDTVENIVYGSRDVAKLIIIAIICNDHILLEDVPGTGKTMLTNTISKMLHLDFKRIQGTPDLLPSDLTGVNIFSEKDRQFHFMPGPIFTNMLLFDEINRASPKTQSALLEAMAERQISIDNTTYPLDKPFFVVATQNPIEHIGTYPAPQAQVDRFLFKTTIGYPEFDSELKILQQSAKINEEEIPKLSKEVIFKWQGEAQKVHLDEELSAKILQTIEKTRDTNVFSLGISPRATFKLAQALRASAFLHNRDYVTKDDVFDLFIPVMAHRVFTNNKGEEKVVLRDLMLEANF